MPGLGQTIVEPIPESCMRIREDDIHYFHEGTHRRLYEILGAHPEASPGLAGTDFAVWAPGARRVSVIGDFNGWRPGVAPLEPRGEGLWLGQVSGAVPGALYKYRIERSDDGAETDIADPVALDRERSPGVPVAASRIWRDDYVWGDAEWMRTRRSRIGPTCPLAIYQADLASWRRVVLDDGSTRLLTYREAAEALAAHLADMGFTHLELLPLMDPAHPASCGFPVGGVFMPSARFGRPDDFMALVDRLHQSGIGVILDWRPCHLAPAPMRTAEFPWSTSIVESGQLGAALDLGRREMRSFLLSAAFYWLDRLHVDGLRLDGLVGAGASGAEPPPAVASFLRELSGAIRDEYPDVLTIDSAPQGVAESEAPPVSASPAWERDWSLDLVWSRSWTREMLGLLETQAEARRLPADDLCPGAPGSEGRLADSWILPLSHAEAASEGRSLLGRMPGNAWERRAQLRLLLGCLYGCPGKKLVFMGSELGQLEAWRSEQSLDWHLLEQAEHRGLLAWVRDLNRLYRDTPALYQRDFDRDGWARMPVSSHADKVLALLRRGKGPRDLVLVVASFMPELVRDCRIGVPRGGWWLERLNSDAWMYGGGRQGNLGGIDADPVPLHGQPSSVRMSLPPFGVLFLDYRGRVLEYGGRVPAREQA